MDSLLELACHLERATALAQQLASERGSACLAGAAQETAKALLSVRKAITSQNNETLLVNRYLAQPVPVAQVSAQTSTNIVPLTARPVRHKVHRVPTQTATQKAKQTA